MASTKCWKTGLDRGFHFFDAPNQILDDGAGSAIQQRDACAGSGSVAGRTHLLEVAIGNHAENGRVLDIDMAAECTRETNAMDVIDAEPLHEQRDPGIKCRLRELNRAHVGLRDLHLHRAPMQHIRERRPLTMRARAATFAAVQHSVF